MNKLPTEYVERMNRTFEAHERKQSQSSRRLRTFEGPLSIAAVSLFVLGYLSVVVYVIVLVNGKH